MAATSVGLNEGRLLHEAARCLMPMRVRHRQDSECLGPPLSAYIERRYCERAH